MIRSGTTRVTLLVTVVAALGLACLDVQGQLPDDAFRLAAGQYARGQWAEAEQSFRELLQTQPEHPQAAELQFFLAESLMECHRYQEALDVYRRFLTEHGNHHYAPRATFRMGESAYRSGNHDLAVRMLEEFIRNQPADPLNEFALTYLGKLRYEREECQLAQLAFETSLRLFPQGALSNDSRLGLAMALQIQGKFAEAKPFYEFLISQADPNLADDARLQLGMEDVQAGQFDAAKKQFESVLARSTDTIRQATAKYWLAKTCLVEGESERGLQMLGALASTLEQEPILPRVLLDGAVAAIEQQQFEMALEWLQRLRNGSPQSPQAREGLGWEIDLLRQQGRTEDAVGLVRRHGTPAQQHQVETAVAEINGRRQYQQQDFEASLKTFQSLLQEEGHSPEQHANWTYMLAMAQLGLNRFADAAATLSRIEADADSDLALMVRFSLASSRLSQKQYGAAIEHLDEYLQRVTNPEDRHRAELKLLVALSGARQWDRLEQQLKEMTAITADPQGMESVLVLVAEQAQESKQVELASATWQRLRGSNYSQASRDRAASELAQLQLDDRLHSGEDDGQKLERLLAIVSGHPDDLALQQAAFARAESWLQQAKSELAIALWDAIADHAADAGLANRSRYRASQALQAKGTPESLREAQLRLVRYVELASPGDLPDIGDVKYQLGWLALDLKNPEASQRWFREVVERHADCRYGADAAYRLIRAAVEANHWDEAENWIRLAQQRDDLQPEVADRIHLFAAQLAARKRDWPAVKSVTARILDHEPGRAEATQALYWKAEAQFQLNDIDPAQSGFQQLATAAGLKPRQQAWVSLRLAQCAAAADDWERVESGARQAMIDWPDFEAIHEFEFLLGRCLEQSGRLTDAREWFQKVVASPTARGTASAAMAQWWIGETYFHQEDFAHAIQAYYQVDSLYDYPLWQSAALLQAGKSQEHLRHPDQAIQLYSQLLIRFPDSEHAAAAQARLELLKQTGLRDTVQPLDGQSTHIGKAPANPRK